MRRKDSATNMLVARREAARKDDDARISSGLRAGDAYSHHGRGAGAAPCACSGLPPPPRSWWKARERTMGRDDGEECGTINNNKQVDCVIRPIYLAELLRFR